MIEGEKDLISDMRIKNIMILKVSLRRASFFVAAKKKEKNKKKKKKEKESCGSR